MNDEGRQAVERIELIGFEQRFGSHCSTQESLDA